MGACCATVNLAISAPGVHEVAEAASRESDECGASSGNCVVPVIASRARFDCSAFLRASKTMLNVVVSQGLLTRSGKFFAIHPLNRWVEESGALPARMEEILGGLEWESIG